MMVLGLPITVLCLFFALSYAVEDNECEKGYIFTCPRSWKTGEDNQMRVTRIGMKDSGSFWVTVNATESYSGNITTLARKEFTLEQDEGESTFSMLLPSSDQYFYNGKITINGSYGSCIMRGTEDVTFSTGKTTICLTQTDKRIYKPGQDVMFRVMHMNKELKPISEAEADVVYVEDPQGTRLFQWKRVPLGAGIKQLEFPLSDQTTQGTWKIYSSFNGELCSTTFEVKEYVLPKFEVKIKPPPYVLSNAELIPFTVYANYTYGKGVKGMMNISMSLEKYAWSSEKTPTIEIYEPIDGYFSSAVNVSNIESDGSYRYRRIMIFAIVTEEGTGVQRNTTQYIQRSFMPLTLEFNQRKSQYFKPGLPFNGELKVTHPDGSVAPDEDIEICAEKRRERIMNGWLAQKTIKVCRNYTSGPTGGIKFTLPPQNTDTISIMLKATATKYAKNPRNNDRQNSLSQPQTSMSITPWYSPSGSFIQLQLEDNVLECDTTKSLKLLFTSKRDADFTFHYEVIYQGKVKRSGSIDKSFSVEDDVSSQYEDEDKLINERETQISPSVEASDNSTSEEDERCKAVREAKYVPPIGEVNIDVDVDASLSPTFYVLVYYMRDDNREIIADSQKLLVQKCLKNKVDFSFGDEEKQPGTKTSILITASPNSLCGIKVVDKSVLLLDSSEQITPEKVYNLIENMDSNNYYAINPCQNKIRQPGLYSKRIVRPGPYSTSSYEDGMTAFTTAGLACIMNMLLVTRPCTRGGNIVYDVNMESADYASYQSGNAGVAMSSARRPAAPVAVHQKAGVVATKSVVDVRNYFPETWLFEMQLTDSEGAFSGKERLPHTITEWVGSAVCISTEDGLGISDTDTINAFQAFFISNELPYSVIRGEIAVIKITIFNYLQDSLPITVSLDKPVGYEVTGDSINKDICIGPDSSNTLSLQIKATEIGQLNLTIHAQTAESSDVCGSASTADVVAKDGITGSILVKAEGWPAEVVQTYLVKPDDEENGVYTKTFTQNLPDDYVPDSATARIDVCGNVMGPSLNSLENLVTVPTGCGEQNMVKFVPNVVVLEYLTQTGQATEQITNRAIRNMNTGAQREMQYRRSDGSFSAFGYRDSEGSMFLTAFVLRGFSSARKFISIDNSTLTTMQEWMVSKQKPDGCFPDVGKIIDHGLIGGIEKEDTGTITAYCLASLLLSDYQNETVINNAMSCIKKDSKEKLNAYTLMLRAYALALAGEKEAAQENIEYVEENYSNKTDGTLHFNIVNGTKSQILETAGYAVLSMLECGMDVAKTLPIIQFMTRNMNRNGGYSSTQDTCVVIESMGEFAKVTNSEEVNVDVTLSGAIDKKISITEDNKLVVNRNEVPSEPSELKIEAKGSGYVLIQYLLRYHTTNPPEKRIFNLEANGVCNDDDCKRGTITITTSIAQEGLQSGMTIVQVTMISGMVPVKDSLDALLGNPDLKLMRYDVENNNPTFYFPGMTTKEKEIQFDVEQIIKIVDPAAGQVEVQDYYNSGKRAFTSYTLGDCDKPESCSKESKED